MASEVLWNSDQIYAFIDARSKYKLESHATPDYVYQQILNVLGLGGQATVEDASKLWESLLTKYKELSQPVLEPEDAAPPSWQFFNAMHEACLSLPTCLMGIEGALGDGGHADEETVEEEAARLEEVFRNGNIVAIEAEENGEVVSEEQDDENEHVILAEFISDDDMDNDDDDDEDDDEDDEEEDDDDNNETAKSELECHQDSSLIDSVWTEERILQLIALRGEKESEILCLGHRPVFVQMVNELGLSDVSTPGDARKKWSSLVRKYFQIKSKMTSKNGSAADTGGKEMRSTPATAKNLPPAPPWPFLAAMEMVMEKIIKTSPDGGMKSRKSPEFLWSLDITKKFIRLRTEKHPEIAVKGHNVVYQEILEKLGIGDRVSVMMARKKWNYLIKKYQDEEMAGGERTWTLMKEMKQVMKHFRGSNASKLKSRASPEFLWPNELTKKFIELRAARHADFIEVGIQNTYTEIMEELGLEHILNPTQMRKKWNYLVAKYKELSCTVGPDGSSPAPHTWPFFEDMQRVMQTIPDHLLNPSKIVRVNFENIWSKDIILKFIELKGTKTTESSKKVSTIFSEIIQELGLASQITPHQARKKWNYLYNKYLDLSHPDVDEFARQSWSFYFPMQRVVGTLPLSQILHKKNIGDELEAVDDDEESQKRSNKRARIYRCFICGKSGKLLNEFFMFEQNQRLLHTQKNVMDIIAYLLNKKVMNLEATTCLCSRCTNLVNDADSLIFRHDRVREETQQLYYCKMIQANVEEERTSLGTATPLTSGCSSTSTASADVLCLSALDQHHPQQVIEEDELEMVTEGQPPPQVPRVTYSKRGRKRKSTVLSDSVKPSLIKTEPIEDDFESVDFDLDEESEDERKKRRKKAKAGGSRGRGRGRGRGKRRRGRPATRTTLIGRGLGGQYPNSNKRKPLPFKGPKIYHCSECRGEFKKYTDLITHRKDIHTVIDTSTLEVQETILENGVVTYFNKGKANNSETSHQCRECDKLFLRKDDLWYHQEISHTEGKGRAKTAFKDRSYNCEECGERFLFKYKLKMHINSKHLNDAGQNANDFTCGDCGCKLGSLPSLTFHMRKHHNKSLTYRKTTEYLCSDCGFMASSNKKLKEHQESHCGASSKPKVQCEVCGKTVLKVSLKMHKVKMHSDFKEQCDRCGERYATKTDLLRHINVVHLRILLYNCQYCGERFPTSDALRYHRVKFHEKPSFYCQVCGKCYKRVGELNTHIKRAHNDRRKAEVCQYCAKEYYDRSGLRNHLVNKHNVPQELTYSENYLRKKRVDGLPLAKHMEKRGGVDVTKPIGPPITQPTTTTIIHHQLQPAPQPHIQQQQQQLTLQPQPTLQVPQGHPGHPGTVVGAHPHMRVVDEAAEAARNLSAYHEMGTTEEESPLVVTEITESPHVEQAVLVDTLNGHQGLMHHPQVAHMQPPMAMHHHMHHQMAHPGNMRLNVLYQMNMHHPGASHLSMQ